MNTTDEFLDKVRKLFKVQKRCRSNLLPCQYNSFKILINLKEKFIVLNTDKNLGPAVIETDTYIQRAFTDHLSDADSYQRLTALDCRLRCGQIRLYIESWLQKYAELLAPKTRTFIKKSTKQVTYDNMLPNFYLLAKIHKTPWKTRPIVSVSCSIAEGLAKFVESELHPLTSFIPTYISSSIELKNKLIGLELPPDAKLFTADAVSM